MKKSEETLHLTLNRKAFEVMVTGEKSTEYRKFSKWIESRLIDKNGNPKEYDNVKFVNGYGYDRPYFLADYKGFEKELIGFNHNKPYSNGLKVGIVEKGDFKIFLGSVFFRGNMSSF